MRSAYPQKLPAGTAKKIFFTDNQLANQADEEQDPEPNQILMLEEETEECVVILWQLAEDTSAALLEEAQVIHCYGTWQKARQNLNATKPNRRFPRGVPPPGKVMSKIICWRCRR